MSDDNKQHPLLQQAIWHYITYNKPSLRRALARWKKVELESQPENFTDIHIPHRSPGRPPSFTPSEESRLKEIIMYFVENNTPLTNNDFKEVVMHFTLRLPPYRKIIIPFSTRVPSDKWIKGFLGRHPTLVCKSMQVIDDDRTTQVTRAIVGEHIARVQAAQQRYNIRDAHRIFNLDKTGISFRHMTRRSLRKGIGARSRNLVTTNVKTKGNLDRVTVMPIVSAAGDAYTPAVVYPGEMAHFRKVQGRYETLHQYLPNCHLYQREIAGVDSSIFTDAIKAFVLETEDLRRGGNKLLLIIDGYASHVQYTILNFLKENGIIVISLSSHTSHVLQPLDVTVFSAYKSYLQRHLHRAAREKRTLDACDVGHIIRLSYSESFTVRNIMSGFQKTGIWDMNAKLASAEALKDLPFYEAGSDKENEVPTVLEVVEGWKSQSGTLLRATDIEESGHVRVNTSHVAHLTDDNILEALSEREERRRAKAEAKDDKERQIRLAPIRAIRRHELKNREHNVVLDKNC